MRSNTDVLYNGLPEARAIIKQAQEAIDESIDHTIAYGILSHVMNYLKGRDPVNPGMWTREFFDTDELTELEFLAIQNMVMDRSAVVTEEEPKLVQITPMVNNEESN